MYPEMCRCAIEGSRASTLNSFCWFFSSLHIGQPIYKLLHLLLLSTFIRVLYLSLVSSIGDPLVSGDEVLVLWQKTEVKLDLWAGLAA